MRPLRRSRGTTLLELVLSMAIVSLLALLMGETGLACVRWRWTADDVVRDATAEGRLRRAVGSIAATARPIEGVAIGPRGELSERRLEGALAKWGFENEALVLRAPDAYWVIELAPGARLVRRRIGFDGHVGEPELVVSGVAALTFVRVLGPPRNVGGNDAAFREASTVGLTYRLELQGAAAPVEGFIALRTEQTRGEPPAAPVPAPRWKGGAR